MDAKSKPYLEYLDKEMTIMGILSAFSVALGSFATEKIISANDQNFLSLIWKNGQCHVITGAVLAVLAAYFFYLQRSLLAWYYGQIALAESLGSSAPYKIEDLLTWADGWSSWIRYQTGFIALSLSFASYAYAVAEVIRPSLRSISPLWSLCIPLSASAGIAIVRWYGFSKFPDEEQPFKAWWLRLTKGLRRR